MIEVIALKGLKLLSELEFEYSKKVLSEVLDSLLENAILKNLQL